jgi:hypothetical protein
MSKKESGYVRERGIKAIIGLQAMAGIVEPREKARAAWAALSDGERESTLSAAKALLPKGWDKS